MFYPELTSNNSSFVLCSWQYGEVHFIPRGHLDFKKIPFTTCHHWVQAGIEAPLKELPVWTHV